MGLLSVVGEVKGTTSSSLVWNDDGQMLLDSVVHLVHSLAGDAVKRLVAVILKVADHTYVLGIV